ncbi:MAG: hypothetical protein JKY11_06140 [Alphaproteobacteria bacterium]|nr:hypothetical protein [Alphaproteobacteria bacterium]
MSLFQTQLEVTQQHDARFDIVNAFKSLDSNRQIVICDQLFHNQRTSYKNTLNLLFPQLASSDAKRLEKFLRSRAQH